MDKLRQTVKMHTSDGIVRANINMKLVFAPLENPLMLKHQDSNILSFTKLKTPIT